MAQNCNKIARLSEAEFDAKGAAAKTATASILQAMSECYKAAEIIHSGQAIERSSVYLRLATTRIDVADAALLRNKEILDGAPAQTDALEWLRDLDYSRLYNAGVRESAIPANDVQWAALVEINRVEGYLGVANGLRDRLTGLKNVIHELVEVLSDEAKSLTNANSVAVSALLSELSNLTAFAQMVAYVNRLEPMDPRWSTSTMTVAEAHS
jgi:hypothetical protein